MPEEEEAESEATPGHCSARAEGGATAPPGRDVHDRCFSGLESALEAGPLKDLDSEKLKSEIKRWAKAVVAYARQLSGGLTGPRERSSEA